MKTVILHYHIYKNSGTSFERVLDGGIAGVLSPVEKEQALADSHKDSPLYAMEEPDDIDLFIRANISEVLLKEAPVNSGEEKEKGTE